MWPQSLPGAVAERPSGAPAPTAGPGVSEAPSMRPLSCSSAQSTPGGHPWRPGRTWWEEYSREQAVQLLSANPVQPGTLGWETRGRGCLPCPPHLTHRGRGRSGRPRGERWNSG